ncbi:hypothetical protein [Streptomyces sp. NPDC001678]|uniref:hypothetical protein n=1 Tax=Streptomyces sp. NPDC001678 TaxID=3364599 RepID=UPI0036A390FC
MKRTILRAAGVSVLAAVAFGVAAPAATAATAPTKAAEDADAAAKAAREAATAKGDEPASLAAYREAARAAYQAAQVAAAKAAENPSSKAAAEAARKAMRAYEAADATYQAARDAWEAAKAADVVTSGPSVAVNKIFLGKGVVASVDVSFDYVCTSATDHVAVEVVSGATTLKATKAKRELQCDGAEHTGFVEWTQRTIATDTPAKATVGLYTKDGELQARVAEKTMKPGYGLPTIG